MKKFVENNVKVKSHLKAWMKQALIKLFNTKMDLHASERMRRSGAAEPSRSWDATMTRP